MHFCSIYLSIHPFTIHSSIDLSKYISILTLYIKVSYADVDMAGTIRAETKECPRLPHLLIRKMSHILRPLLPKSANLLEEIILYSPTSAANTASSNPGLGDGSGGGDRGGEVVNQVNTSDGSNTRAGQAEKDLSPPSTTLSSTTSTTTSSSTTTATPSSPSSTVRVAFSKLPLMIARETGRQVGMWMGHILKMSDQDSQPLIRYFQDYTSVAQLVTADPQAAQRLSNSDLADYTKEVGKERKKRKKERKTVTGGELVGFLAEIEDREGNRKRCI